MLQQAKVEWKLKEGVDSSVPDLQTRGGGHPGPKIRGGEGRSPKNIFGPLGLSLV